MKKIALLILVLFGLGLNSEGQTYTDVKKMSFSTKDYAEFAPAWYDSGLVYCTNYPRSIYISREDGGNQNFFDIYYINPTEGGRKKKAPINLSMNTLLHDGPLALSPDGKFVVSARNRKVAKGSRDTSTVELCLFQKADTSLKFLEVLPFCDERYNYGHPAFSADGKYLWFASDMPGGQGGFDVWRCIRDERGWGKPENPGIAVNSGAGEIFPFVHSSGRLYFSSNRNDSTGKYDVFSIIMDNGAWLPAERLPEPINSKYNDYSLICDESTENGYFASDRSGGDDIYRFFNTLPIFEQCDTMILRNYCYTFFESNYTVIDSFPLIYQWSFGDSTTARGIEVNHCFSGPGLYTVVLIIVDTLTNEVNHEQANYELLIEDAVQPYFDIPDTIAVHSELILDAAPSNLPGMQAGIYVWTISDGERLVGSKVSKFFTEPGEYTIHLGVAGKSVSDQSPQKVCVWRKVVVE